MKTQKLLFSFVFFFLFLVAHSQMEEKREKIKALKVGFITSELQLTADEAAKFWPLYNVYDDQQFEIKHQKMRGLKEKLDSDLNKLTEKEAANLLAQMENYDNELHQSRKKFNTNVKAILSSVKILKLKKAEDNFNRKLLQQYRNKGPK